MTDTFLADISSWQQPVNRSYPYPVLSFRVDHGGGIDDHAAANWSFVRDTPRILIGIAYVVFIPGQGAAILNRVKTFFGAHGPAKLVVMIDMESGSGFAGPGNHSTEANVLAAGLAAWLGSTARVTGYANGGDWDNCWPTRPSWLKRTVASYGSQDPGAFQWQFYGGMPYPTPASYPRSCPPFGSNVDLNVIHHSPAELVSLFGLTPAPATPGRTGDMFQLIFDRDTRKWYAFAAGYWHFISTSAEFNLAVASPLCVNRALVSTYAARVKNAALYSHSHAQIALMQYFALGSGK